MDFLNDFDIDGDGTFSYDEFLLFLVLLSMPLKDMQVQQPFHHYRWDTGIFQCSMFPCLTLNVQCGQNGCGCDGFVSIA